MAAAGWGTWEELILGGAVLRHGTNHWNDVASEVRARTFYPCAFTPQACKERYEELQKRYSSSKSWFEELRNQRVAELKRELAKSEDSIGSLESKIKSLKCEKRHSGQPDCGSNHTESPFGRETLNNENSAGSFTNENREDKESCPKILAESNYEHVVVVRKRRGPRSRKDCNNNQSLKERSVGASDNLSTVKKELSSNDCGPVVRDSSDGNDHCEDRKKDCLIGIFKAVSESEPAAVFRHRMDSQKRARYRRVIKQHVDIGTIRSRIIGQSIKSARELFRDLLLVANNALVFYSRRTREYKSALSLRGLVMEEYKKHCRGYYHELTSDFIPCNPPVRPRTARPRPRSRPPTCENKVVQIEDVVADGLDKVTRLEGDVLQVDRPVKDRKGFKCSVKSKREVVDEVCEESRNCAVKQRKKVRR